MRLTILFFFFAGLLKGLAQEYRTAGMQVSINDKGQVTSLRGGGKNHVPAREPGVLLRLVIQGETLLPETATFSGDRVQLSFKGGAGARVKIRSQSSYLVFTLEAVSKEAEAVKWGAFHTILSDTIGGTAGVVRSADFAIGLQGLNLKTTGGELVNEEGAIFERGTTAVARPFGSSLQAFTVNRSVDRKIKVWDRWPEVPVKAIAGGEPEGSSVALFGCVPGRVPAVIREIIVQEKLPYAQWKGEWIKTSVESGRPYLITTFTEKSIDIFLDYAEKMGMAGVYHEDPFDTWGHFEMKKAYFPNGRKGFRACVDKAHARGLRLGFHTLTTFITTNDPYVSPRPDHRLAAAGSALLKADLPAEATEIPVSADLYFRLRSDLNSVRIGDEIIRFREVSEGPPYRLMGCARGAFGTAASVHKAGEEVVRLIDHPYKVFFPDWEMQQEVAANLVAFINETGADQMDFDGHEGTYATGMGDLSLNTFAEQVFRGADHPVVMGSSRDNHYFRHFNHYLNWGEPWYGSFRESQTDVRLAYQPVYENNYMPNMLGWFLITAQTAPDDIDWMLARAAGFDAGYALVLRKEALDNPQMEEIIRRINLWTAAQRQGLFDADLRKWLKDPRHDARLVEKEGSLYLQQFEKYAMAYEARVLQPGQPTAQYMDFENRQSDQVPLVVIHASGDEGAITNPVIELDNAYRLELPVRLEAGQTLMMSGAEKQFRLYDRKGRLLRKADTEKSLPGLNSGWHTLGFDCTTDANTQVKINIEIKLLNNEIRLRQ